MNGILSKEHYFIMAQFESMYKEERLDHEKKELWPKGYIYQDGKANQLFIAFRKGYALGIMDSQS